mmetsp:Transcript_8526/g.21639  ORF Transcript_8526/g.21639 Transcript_8526/m.21639 type:complete len:236 (-) Transcript_8526:96-803(-)
MYGTTTAWEPSPATSREEGRMGGEPWLSSACSMTTTRKDVEAWRAKPGWAPMSSRIEVCCSGPITSSLRKPVESSSHPFRVSCACTSLRIKLRRAGTAPTTWRRQAVACRTWSGPSSEPESSSEDKRRRMAPKSGPSLLSMSSSVSPSSSASSPAAEWSMLCPSTMPCEAGISMRSPSEASEQSSAHMSCWAGSAGSWSANSPWRGASSSSHSPSLQSEEPVSLAHAARVSSAAF